MNSIEIRNARIEDVESIFSIQTECGLSPWPRSAYEAEVNREDSIILVAAGTNSDTAGFITGRVIPAGSGPSSHAEIYNLGVRERLRRQGTGSALLDRFVNICMRFGVGEVFLEVRKSNLAAIGFYGVHGFVKTGERKNFYADPVESAEIMTMRLEGQNPA